MRSFSLAGTAALVALAAISSGASAAEPRPFGKLDCVAREGVRFCEGSLAKRVPTFDGVPIDLNVTLPPAPAAGSDGPYPLIVGLHGYGGEKRTFDAGPPHEGPKRLAQRGYVVLNPTARGFYDSCGTPESREADPAGCARGWLHLDDHRFEVRDVQFLAGKLVDQGLVDPLRIGAWADSYGGAPALALGVLRDKVMLGALPGEEDGRLVQWRSPGGAPMRLAAAAPYQTWSDVGYSLLPNGRTLDYTVTGPADDTTPIGVMKETFVSGFYATGQVNRSTGQTIGYYAPPGADPDADLHRWYAAIQQGEPYEPNPVIADAIDELRRHHSSYYIETGARPAPLLLSNGFTDDLFPSDEALRLRNKLRSLYPDAPIGLWFADFGHQRGAEKAAVIERRQQRIFEWFDHYVKGEGRAPFAGVEALTQTCPKEAPAGGPFRASSWSRLHPGEVRLSSPAPKTIVSSAGDPAIGRAIDPVLAGQSPCAATPSADQSGVATYRLPAAGGRGYTLLGSPTVIGSLIVAGQHPQIAARLWDVAPDGTQTLVARGLYRPAGGGPVVFQLHANGWLFAAGHVPKLELLGQDPPYARPSNGAFSLTLSDLELRLPVREPPGEGPVEKPKPPVLPPGARLAPDEPEAAGRPRGRARLVLRVGYRLRRASTARCRRTRAVLSLGGADRRSVRRMEVRATRRGARVDRRAPYRLTVPARGARSLRLRVRAVLTGGRTWARRHTLRFCPHRRARA